MIPFNRPHVTGREQQYLEQAVRSGKLSGNGELTMLVQGQLRQMTGAAGVLLTTSCSTALDMAAILSDVGAGDEVIVPSFTFPSTVNAFVLRGATPVFADSGADFPNVTAGSIEPLITRKTRVIVLTHYAGVPCDMDQITALAEAHKLLIIEDGAMALGSRYKGTPVGRLSPMTTFSFHETKVIGCGEGGALALRLPEQMPRAEIIWEKGTNRAAFQRGEADHYEWVDLGSSFLPGEIQAAWLHAQLEERDQILQQRKQQWNRYFSGLQHVLPEGYDVPVIPDFADHNGSIFYLRCPTRSARDRLIGQLRKAGIMAVFHYLPLHRSEMGRKWSSGQSCPEAENWSDTLIRLPLYHDLSIDNQLFIIDTLIQIITAAGSG